MDCPPGIQLLHSLKNEVTGGASIFVDSFRAVELLREKYPEDYHVLTTVPVTFHYVNNGHHMHYRRPTIVTGEDKSGPAWDMHVNYAPPFQGPMDHLSPSKAKEFYRAFQRFADLIEDERLRFELTLKPGQLGNPVTDKKRCVYMLRCVRYIQSCLPTVVCCMVGQHLMPRVGTVT